MNAAALKKLTKDAEGQHVKASQVRLHRAISWLARAEAESGDLDAQFVFLWISFNAAYARELGLEQVERDTLSAFFGSLLTVDQDRRLHHALFGQFSGPIRTLIDNQFVFEPFWRALREHDSSDRWEKSFVASKKAALGSVLGGDTLRVLSIVFDRLYVLRNQLVHGGATWNSGLNRSQLKDGVTILMTIIPIFIELMIRHHDLDFGAINYPVVG